ncbi:MAG: VWA domain-containing protein [Desulfobacterales bacterium]|nr:VWA domain-containing protein [Desulfobacterales bacterium]
MTLARLWVLHFLWLIPLVILALIVQHRQRRTALAAYADPALLARLVPMGHRGRGVLKGVFLATAVGLLILALAGPRWGSHYQEVSRKGVDIMILMDVSTSMRVEDIQPNRFERARREIIDLLRVVQGDRIGLVAFAGAAFVQCPLTLDYTALQMFLDSLEPGQLSVQGTDLGAAIRTGLSAFDMKTATDKVMLLITDGEDNEAQGLAAAQTAARNQVNIFVFGIGDPSGGPIPAANQTGGFKKDAQGRLVLSKLNEASLLEIAAETGGTYVRSVAGDLDLDLLYFDGVRSRTQARDLKSGKVKVYEERFAVFVAAVFILLLLEGLIDPFERSPRLYRRRGFSILLLTAGALWLLTVVAVPAAEHPDDLYRQGKFAEAEKGYSRLDMDYPKKLRYRYNRGCAAFQNSDAQGAAAAFSSVLKRSADPVLQFNSVFNLGNIAYQKGDHASAAAFYRQAVLLDPASEDARYNLEMALRQLEKSEQKNKSPQPPGSSDNKADSPDKDKKGQPSVDNPSRPQDADGQPPGKHEDPPSEADPQKSDYRPQQNEKSDTENPPAPEDLKGDLKARQDLSEPIGPTHPPAGSRQGIDRKRAAALLDNIKEDRSRMIQFQRQRANGHAAQSGKDW